MPAEVVPISDEVPRTTKDAILAQLRSSGQIRTGVLARRLDAPLSTVSSTLRRLEQEGLAKDLGYGEWSGTDTAA